MKNEDVGKVVRQTLGSNIRLLRQKSGRSSTDFADIACVNRSYFSQVEHGKANASVGVLCKIASALDVPITELFAGLEGHVPGKLADNTGYAFVRIPGENADFR